MQARKQAKQSIETVHQETENSLRSRLAEAESKAAAEMKRRLDQAEAEAREIERRAKEHFLGAVEMVVDWVATGPTIRNCSTPSDELSTGGRGLNYWRPRFCELCPESCSSSRPCG